MIIFFMDANGQTDSGLGGGGGDNLIFGLADSGGGDNFMFWPGRQWWG